MLPVDLQVDAQLIYKVLRTIDDLVDESDPRAAHRIDALECWAQGQEANTPETRILTDLSQRHVLPRAAVGEFCQGMRDDLDGASIEDEEALERYCQQAGGSVGIMLASMFGTTHTDGVCAMATLGRAFQRTNIIRDIDEDREHGRLYIARTTIERFGPPLPGAREALLRDQIARADRLYEEGLSAIPLLSRGRRGMALATALYREILRQIERTGYGRTAGRVAVPAWRVRVLSAKHRAMREHDAS